jgi:hypothetical protein
MSREPYADSWQHIQELNNEMNRVLAVADDLDTARNIWALLAHNLADALKCGCIGHSCQVCAKALADYERWQGRQNNL